MDQTKKFCTNCGEQLAADAEFCGKCGAKQTVLRTAPDAAQKEIVIETTQAQPTGNESKTAEPADKPAEPAATAETADKSSETSRIATEPAKSPDTQDEPVAETGVSSASATTTDQVAEFTKKLAEKNPLPRIFKTCGEFIKKHKAYFIAGASVLAVIIIGVITFNCLYDFTTLNWDTEKADAEVSMTEATSVDLGVVAYDREKQPITEIEFAATNGDIEVAGTEVTWHLPAEEGEYKITAKAPSGKQIEKTIKVVRLTEEQALAGYNAGQSEEDPNRDSDKDGIIDTEEEKYGTDPNLMDTDGDGLIDYYEINISKTDPLKADSDDDGLRDGDEIMLGLNPLLADSKNDGQKDGERTLSYQIKSEKTGVELEITGQGNIASATVDVVPNTAFAKLDGALGKVYNFYTDGKIEKAKVQIPYDTTEVLREGLNEDKLSLFYFDEESKRLELVPTTVDKTKGVLQAELSHFSRYVVADVDVVVTDIDIDVMFVIDNSVSMYSEAQMEAAGYGESTGAIGNDTGFRRLTLTNSMMDKLTGSYRFGVAEFSGDYVNLQQFTAKRDTAKSAVDEMRSQWSSNGDGTNITTALRRGIGEFSNTSDARYLILLTDGKDTSSSFSSNKKSLISSAKSADVKVCVIGIGNDLDTEILTEIATETGCGYYKATNSAALDEIYNLIGASINFGFIDTDQDDKTDAMINADSGFLVNRDGFPFANFNSNKSDGGHCYGMALFAQLYYQDKLPLSMGKLDNSTLFHRNQVANGYNLYDTYFANGGNLYDFEFTTPGLKLAMGKKPADFRDRIEDDTWLIKPEYVEQMKSVGVTTKVINYKQKSELGSFSKAEKYLLSLNDDTLTKAATKGESGLLDAIWRLYILQYSDKRISFECDPDQAFDRLVKELNNDNPVPITINGNHEINAIRLLQDDKDANKFKLEVYDNNYPGETRYIEIERHKLMFPLDFTTAALTNEYGYKFLYNTQKAGTAPTKTTVSVSLPTVE